MPDFTKMDAELLDAIAQQTLVGIYWTELSIQDVLDAFAAGIEMFIDGDSRQLLFKP